jgi:endo-1,4-beta-xylanase
MSFAVSHKLAFRGHALVWYATVPEWAKTTLTSPAQARAELLLEVTEPCRHFRGRMDSWDVVNEVVDPKSPNGLRASFWLQMIGPDYIPLAFTAARQADPSAILVLNENHLEYDIPSNEQKREAVLDLLRALRRDNVPVDALGIEAHLAVSDKFPFNPSVFDGFLSQVHELGLKILITEMDVNDDALPADIPARDSAVAKAYGDFLGVVLRHPGVVTVTVWGLSDRHTWISTFGPRADGVPVRPTLLDSNLARKPAYFAVQTAFNGASLSGVQNRLRPGWAYMK